LKADAHGATWSRSVSTAKIGTCMSLKATGWPATGEVYVKGELNPKDGQMLRKLELKREVSASHAEALIF